MKKLIAFSLTVFFYFNSKAQVPMTVYAELGGPGIMSVNFDSRFSSRENGLGGRIGIGGMMLRGDEDTKITLTTFPVGVNYLLGKDGKNYFEIGAGYTYINITGKTREDKGVFEGSFGNLTLGYRLAPANGGFLFKAQITPIFGRGGFIPYYGGIGFGYKF